MSVLAKLLVAMVVLVAVFALTWLVYFPHSPLGKQEANLRLAADHRPMVEQRLRQIPGAESVKVGRFTGLGGSMSVSGEVPDHQTAEVVIREVMATAPPVIVDFNLTVGGTDMVQRIVEQNVAANRSQPVSRVTNSTSAAAGSGR